MSFIWCQVRTIDGEFTLTVHDEIRWVERGKLLEMDLAPADIPIAQRLIGEIKEKKAQVI